MGGEFKIGGYVQSLFFSDICLAVVAGLQET